MICTIRIPDVLQARIDSEAGESGRSKWILEACRMRLDAVGDNSAVEVKTVNAGMASLPSTPHAGANPDHSSKLTMQALRDICAGKLSKSDVDPMIPDEVPICGKTWWEDGEEYECLMDAGHREQKHGLRGMVRVIS